jgi:hypothetical protein
MGIFLEDKKILSRRSSKAGMKARGFLAAVTGAGTECIVQSQKEYRSQIVLGLDEGPRATHNARAILCKFLAAIDLRPDQEAMRLKRRLAKVEPERDLLEEAAAYFAKEST